ncbi:hypothetical protein [Pedobacter sp. FW305-3-2-15-E-R2A2]|uniref:hypothetical protein n=1 Tax=Pedobacter sp. FW305-3-2-15-E-R2A2 TaxID=3140251 RepID=UPI003140176E
MKYYFKLIIISFIISAVYLPKVHAQNILNLQGWAIGTGSSGIFGANGQESENLREWGEGPRGERAILWKASPDGNTDADGGWNSDVFPISNINMYRFAVWIKKTNSNTGNTYHGCSNVLNLDGTSNDNPYFWFGVLPELNKWYLLVGYVHASNDASVINYGGIYDGTTGTKVLGITDFKFSSTAVNANHRAYLYYDPNVSSRQFFYAPRVDLVNGNEPTIASLLGLQGVSGDLTYFPGKVGIKTSVPGDYELAVKGKIRAQEIKVEGGIWPDYVFEDNYKLLSLPDLEKYIKLNKHLPSMAPAKKMESDGVSLGETNRKLLEKLEEVTLHLIDLDKKISLLEKENTKLKKEKIK